MESFRLIFQTGYKIAFLLPFPYQAFVTPCFLCIAVTIPVSKYIKAAIPRRAKNSRLLLSVNIFSLSP